MKYLIKNKEGVVLIFTFMIMVAVAAITMAFLFMTSTRMRGAGYDVASHKALWLAEAGFQDVIFRLGDDAAYRADPGLVSANLGDGSYSVNVTRDGNTYTMVSTGSVSVESRQFSQSVIYGDVYSNVLYTASTINTKNATNLSITGTQVEGAASLLTVDFPYYKGIASPGQDIAGNYTFNSGTYSGIWYITGDVTIKSNVTINGTVVTEKKIKASKNDNIDFNPTSNYPAMIANDDINFDKSENFSSDGLIYAGADGSGKFKLKDADDANVTGVVVSSGKIDLSKSDAVTITYDSSIADDPPPGISGGGIELQRDWDEI